MPEIIKPKTVTDYLNEVRYGDDLTYVPSEFSLRVVNLIKLIEGGNPENKTPVVHYKMLDNFVVSNGLNTINMCHRGIAKTTLKEYFMWYIAIFNTIPNFGTVPYALYVSDSMENGVKKMRISMEDRWNRSKFLQEYIPRPKFTDPRWEFNNKDGGKFVVTGHGAKSGVRGTRENNSRPVLALMDDLLSDDDARSPTVIASIEATIKKAIRFALHPSRRKIIWSGTPFNAGDPLYKAVESGAWNVNVYPVCEQFPCTREQFRGSWEDRFTYDSISAEYKALSLEQSLDAFNQELMLRIMADEDRMVMDSDIQWYKRSDIIKSIDLFNIYITTDFATSEKRSADFSVISVWAINDKGYMFWIDGICKRQTMDKNLNDLFRFAQRYQPLSVGIEVTGQQGGFVSIIEQQMMDRKIWFNLASENNSGKGGIRPKTEKFARFQLIVPWFKTKMMYFPLEMKDSEPMVEAYNELSLVANSGFKSKHDDFIDTVSMLQNMNIIRPSSTINMVQDTSGLWEPEVLFDDSCGYESYVV